MFVSALVPRTLCLACCASHLQRQMFDARCWSHRAPPSPEQLDWRAFFTNHTFCCHRTRVCLPLVAIWWRPVATRVADFFITKLWIQMTLGIQWSSGHISDTQRTYFHRCLWNPSIGRPFVCMCCHWWRVLVATGRHESATSGGNARVFVTNTYNLSENTRICE